jgi:hypothetical protein
MSAEMAIGALLRGHAPLIALVGARIFNGEIPQGAALPAVALNHISTTERSTAGMSEAAALATTRIEVAVQSKTYPQQKALLAAARAACKNKRGIIAGLTVHSVLSDTVGPDMFDGDTTTYMQTIDFMVSYTTPI